MCITIRALPGNAYSVALPPVHRNRWQSHQVCIPRQSPSRGKFVLGKKFSSLYKT